MNVEVELLPMRSLDDFLLRSARFQIPNYKNLEKWGNRVTQNLLYYQTNYLALIMATVSLAVFIHPVKMLSGAFCVIILGGFLFYYVNAFKSGIEFRKNHSWLGIVIILGGVCSVFYFFGSLLTFLFAIVFPIFLTFVHASLRLRNIKNKLSSIERMVFKQTPMGLMLDLLGVEQDCIS